MQSTMEKSEQKANATVTSKQKMPPARSEKGKRKAVGRQQPIHVMPSASPETDRREAIEPLTPKPALPHDDHSSSDDLNAAIIELARIASEAHVDRRAAAVALLQMIDTRNGESAAMNEEMRLRGALETIDRSRTAARESFKRPPAKPCRFNLESAAKIGGMILSVLDKWMVGSKRLGDCTAEDLLKQASEESNAARGHRKAERFYRAIADRVGNKPVRKVLSVNQINEIGREIYGPSFGKE